MEADCVAQFSGLAASLALFDSCSPKFYAVFVPNIKNEPDDWASFLLYVLPSLCQDVTFSLNIDA